jgi:hypothetical protein
LTKTKTAFPSSLSTLIVGAWKRCLFYGSCFEHSSDMDEDTFNLQSDTLFIDLRIPKSRDALLSKSSTPLIQSLLDMNQEQLAFYARQHIFAGYSQLELRDQNEKLLERRLLPEDGFPSFDVSCTRHHCIDWNFVGMGRTRPNKWWIEPCPRHPTRSWKEWAYATDDKHQHYYCERWEHLSSQDDDDDDDEKETAGNARRVAFRKLTGRYGIIIVIGDYFNYILDRSNNVDSERYQSYATGSLAGTVDAALHDNDLDAARAWLSIQGGHGRINNKGEWNIERAIEFWKEGEMLFWPANNKLQVTGDAIENCQLVWNQEPWEVFETNLNTVEEIRALFSPTMTVQKK